MLRSRGTAEPATPRVEIVRMRRRHLRGVMAIERQAYSLLLRADCAVVTVFAGNRPT